MKRTRESSVQSELVSLRARLEEAEQTLDAIRSGSVDALVIGRKTFEIVLALPEWPYGDKHVVVLSSRPLDLSPLGGAQVEQMSGTPQEIHFQL